MCQALLEQLKADAEMAVELALDADGPSELLAPRQAVLLSGLAWPTQQIIIRCHQCFRTMHCY